MGTKEQIDYWIKASELDFISSTEIFNSGKMLSVTQLQLTAL